MEFEEIIVTKLCSTLVKVSLKKSILVFVFEEGGTVGFPALFELLCLTDVNTAIVRIQNSVNSRFEGVGFVVE
jgi:hypothetical protein